MQVNVIIVSNNAIGKFRLNYTNNQNHNGRKGRSNERLIRYGSYWNRGIRITKLLFF